MNLQNATATNDYRFAMGRLLMLYMQVDRLIMEICAERLDDVPDERAELALAKQVGDESRHVSIQQEWMHRFGVDATPVITPAQERAIRNHFRALPWLDFLADMYLGEELARLPEKKRHALVEGLPARIEVLVDVFGGFGIPVRSMFEAVGADYDTLRQTLYRRRDELLADLAAASLPQAAQGQHVEISNMVQA